MKSCVPCKFYVKGKYHTDTTRTCEIPSSEWRDKITGNPTVNIHECHYMREKTYRCGPNAKLFVHRHWLWRLFT